MANGNIRAWEILHRLSDRALIVGAEIGVFGAETSKELLKDERVILYMVDNWRAKEDQPQAYVDSGDYHANRLGREQQDVYKLMALSETMFAKDRRREMWMDSVDAAKFFDGPVLDFVFIDADHSYEGCRSDIRAWRGNIKPGGILGGHDYALPTHPKFGVKRAVDEAVDKYGWRLDLGENYTWFVRL